MSNRRRHSKEDGQLESLFSDRALSGEIPWAFEGLQEVYPHATTQHALSHDDWDRRQPDVTFGEPIGGISRIVFNPENIVPAPRSLSTEKGHRKIAVALLELRAAGPAKPTRASKARDQAPQSFDPASLPDLESQPSQTRLRTELSLRGAQRPVVVSATQTPQSRPLRPVSNWVAEFPH